MSDFVTLSCPTCGGKLEITNDVERFACGYCGNEHIVKRGGGIITILPVTEEIRKIQVGVDKTASELAITRLEKEVNELKLKNKKLPEDLLKKYESTVLPCGIDFIPYILLKHLTENKYEEKLGVFESAKLYNIKILNHMHSLTIDDIDFITEKSLFEAIKPKAQNRNNVNAFIDDIKYLKEMLVKNLDLIEKNEKEIVRLKQIVSS